MALVTTAFEQAARLRARSTGMADQRLVLVSHPMASKTPHQIEEEARKALSAIVTGLVEPKPAKVNQ